MKSNIGHYAFIIGVILAIIAGIIVTANPWVVLVLVVLGLVVGFMNVTAKETTPFLVASIALIAAGSANLTVIPYVGSYLSAMLSYIAVFVAPAAIVVALKAVKDLAAK
ncbi:hypothetical protein LDC_0049 [sediment metagenome]|uniref:Uncharacterized protein n=1 Tax=sediment metagenome TaxID=749907 RepID=D9PEX1_9ZZZZ